MRAGLTIMSPLIPILKEQYHLSAFLLSFLTSLSAIAFLGRTLAADLTHTGVEVFTICPGATNTPMFAASTLNDLSESDRKELIEALPKSRLIEPQEIAELGFFLASESGKILHGAVIDASMGLGVNPGLLKK